MPQGNPGCNAWSIQTDKATFCYFGAMQEKKNRCILSQVEAVLQQGQAGGVQVQEQRVGVRLGDGVVESADRGDAWTDAADHQGIVRESEGRLQGVNRRNVVVNDAGKEVRNGRSG